MPAQRQIAAQPEPKKKRIRPCVFSRPPCQVGNSVVFRCKCGFHFRHPAHDRQDAVRVQGNGIYAFTDQEGRKFRIIAGRLPANPYLAFWSLCLQSLEQHADTFFDCFVLFIEQMSELPGIAVHHQDEWLSHLQDVKPGFRFLCPQLPACPAPG